MTSDQEPLTLLRGPAPRTSPRVRPLDEVRFAWQSLLGPAPLPAKLLEQLMRASTVRRAAAGQQVLSRLQRSSAMQVLVQGDVGLGVLTPPAPLRIERHLHAPAWLDLGSAWLNCPPALDGVALGEAVIVDVLRSEFQRLMEREPGLTRRTVDTLAQQVHAATTLAHDLMHKDARARLATWLLQHRGAQDPATARIVLRERKRDIASQLAMTAETLSRLLKHFSDDGLLRVDGYSIAVLDPAGLLEQATAVETR